MKTKCQYCYMALALLALSTLNSEFSAAHAQGTAFTYQGRLNTNATPANGLFDFQFVLSNAASGGSQIGSAFTVTGVGVTNGLFTTTLNFGSVFTGEAAWLAISVRSNGVGNYTPMTPLQELTPTPYSITAENVTTITLGQLPAGVVTNNETGVTLSNVTVDGNLNLPATTTINSGGSSLLYADGNGDFFAGQGTGNTANAGGDNTAIGDGALAVDTTGRGNTVSGVGALSLNTSGEYNEANGYWVLFNNTSGSYNTANGTEALYYNTNGSYNTANGFQALLENKSGSFNTADGLGALVYNVTGSNNTANGTYALYELGLIGSAGGSENIAIGYNAGANFLANETSNIDIGNPGVYQENNVIRLGSGQTSAYIAGVIYGNGAGLTNLTGSTSSGAYDTATGVGALELNATGSDNSAFGVDALAFNNSGSSNTAVGANALGFTGAGSYNTAIGMDTLVFSSGGGNTAVGLNALFNNRTAYNSVAVGYNADMNNEGGLDTVAIGVSTFQSQTTGIQNTAVGTYAFQNMTAGSGNVGLGYYAGNSLVSGSNNIYIGSAGSSADNNLIRIGGGQSETIIDGGSVGINTSTPSQALEVNGNFAQVDGANAANGSGPIDAYIGGNGSGSDVQVGSMNSNIGNVAFYNWGNSTYMHIYCSAITIEGGSDLAEPFTVSSSSGEIPQGSVVVIDEENPGRLKVSSQPYDTRVAGVLSGANGVNPGIQMQQQGLLEGGKNVALTGRVYVLADAANGAIKPGDMLTTSETPGHAMKVTDHARASGAILGKAMSSLKQGKGMVLVLVTLQ